MSGSILPAGTCELNLARQPRSTRAAPVPRLGPNINISCHFISNNIASASVSTSPASEQQKYPRMQSDRALPISLFLPMPAPVPLDPHKYVVVLNGWPGVGKRAIAASICEKAGTPDLVAILDHCSVPRAAPPAMNRNSVEARQMQVLEYTRRMWRDENLAPKLGRAGAV